MFFTKFTKKKDKRSNLDKEIDSILFTMSNYDMTSEEYTRLIANLERLIKMKEQESKKHISPDTIAIIAGNLLGIALILTYEKVDIITTKALGFVLKGRV